MMLLLDNDVALGDAIASLKGRKVLGVDTETTGLDPHTDKVRLIQLASEGNPVYVVDCFKCDALLLEDIMLDDSVIKVFHNAKFDLQFLYSMGLKVSQTVFDTFIAYKLINGGKNVKGGLAKVCEEYLGEAVSKEERLSDWSKPELDEGQLKYAAIDAQVLLDLRDKLKDDLVKLELVDVAKIEFDCVFAIAMMEWNGMLIDIEAWKLLLWDAEDKKEYYGKQLQAIFTERLFDKRNTQLGLAIEGYDFSEKVNLDSHVQLLANLKKIGIEVEDTNSNTLRKSISKHGDVIKPLLEYKKNSKILSSFGESFLEKVNPATGRIHGSYWQLGSAAGRLTSSNPNLQQIPRGKAYRQCFIPSPNHQLIIADYSQIELRIASEVANDKTMIDAYLNGEDLHKLTASIVLSKPLENVTKDDRQIAKACNFGLIYGSGVNGFRGYAEGNYGIKLSEEEAKNIMDNFFKSYSGLAIWHQNTKSKFYDDGEGVSSCRTLSGRIRHFTDASPQQALNTPIQGTGADMLKLALGNLYRNLEGTGGKILATVHDEIILEAPIEEAESVAKILTDTMVSAGKTFLKIVPVEADSSIGYSWADK